MMEAELQRQIVEAAGYLGWTQEADFQLAVIELAELYGWRWFAVPDWAKNLIMQSVLKHPRRGKRALPKGWPDLVLVRREASGDVRGVVAELKAQRGRVSPDQAEWLAIFDKLNIETFVWRPSDWDSIAKVLR